VIVNIGGTEFEEMLDGCLYAELKSSAQGSMFQLNLALCTMVLATEFAKNEEGQEAPSVASGNTADAKH
jgi:hypothetical protein